MRDMIRPLSTPSASAYMPESGTTPAPMPPPIIGMATYMIASTKPYPSSMPTTPTSRQPMVIAQRATGRKRTAARSSSERLIPRIEPVISAAM